LLRRSTARSVASQTDYANRDGYVLAALILAVAEGLPNRDADVIHVASRETGTCGCRKLVRRGDLRFRGRSEARFGRFLACGTTGSLPLEADVRTS
jgi:hypothetical protein